MTKRKSKSQGSDVAMPAPSSGRRGHQSTSLDEAENGFIVNHSSEGPNGYSNKRYIAKSKPEALAIASTCMAGGHGRGGKGKRGAKKGNRKAVSGKAV